MKKLTGIVFFLLSAFNSKAVDGEYAFSKIPVTLLKDAHVIKRMEDIRYEINSLTKTKLYNKYALTILDESGDDFAYLYESYDKLRSIKSIEGKLFDATGKELKSLKNKDVEDRSNVSGISLMEDNRIKIHNFYYKVYPYTIEYEVVTEFNNTYMFPPWFPQPAEKYAVEKSSMTITCPSSFTFQYKMFNYKGTPVVTEIKNEKNYKWQVTNLSAILKEYADPEWPYLTTAIYFKPDKFEFEGYNGTMSSWKDLGDFQVQLNKGRDVLPDAIKQKIHQLTDAVTDPKEKVRILYEYMQKNTRYISIQLGIGGFQPFEASYVAKNAYGDCKALSNYMYSILKEVNIKSCYTQIKSGAGEYFFMPDFSTDQFDHIILCVPMAKDTMWLECTSQTLPAGYLGDFTCDRYALTIDENGGHLIRTPKYGMKDNREIRNITAVLDADATLIIKSQTAYSGLQQDDYHGIINNLSKDKVKEILNKRLDFATYDIKDFNYTEKKSAQPVVNEALNITVNNYATITGKRLFIVPNVMTRTHRKLLSDTERKHDLDLGFEFNDIDSVEIELPAGYEKEAMPQDVSITSKFGKYKCSIKLTANKLFYYRNYEHYSGLFPAKDYPELVKFYEDIYKADRNKVVLVKNEEP